MRRIDFLGLAVLYIAGFLLVGCSKQPAQPAADETPTPVTIVADDTKKPEQLPPPFVGGPGNPAETTATSTGLTKQEQYDAALLEGLSLIADHKYADALLKMVDAKTIDDTEQIRQEIDKLKNRINQQSAADQTTQDIKTVLADGKLEDAARLATTGLQQFGGDNPEQLARLKRQADALATGENDNKDARRRALRDEGDTAFKERNLRAAAIAYEQVLLLGDDADLKKQFDDLRATLARYDENRQRAAELRRDPANLEDAIAALQEAQKAWHTVQIRDDIDDYTLALQKRRDRIGVADFEVRGDVGIPAAGRAMAEELLPNFKKRYDLVERAQLGKIVEELKLEVSDLAGNDKGRREVGRLAKVRFLVLGSITPMSGITVNARLVDVHSGLIVQTAKLVAPTPDKLMQRLPDLAAMLQMSDKEKMDYEEQLAKQAADDVKPVNAAAELPAPPAVPAADAAPPPVVAFAPRPPDLGGVKAQDFAALPPPPAAGQFLPALAIGVAEEIAIKERMLQVAIELGDNSFRRGRFREAHFQFNLALNLFPDRRDVRLRVDRVNLLLPPDVGAVGVPAPVFVPAPRLAVLNFLVFADPNVVSPALSPWLAENLAPYFSPPFEVVDRGFVFWYMRRAGMTYRDLFTNPYARRWLGRALNLRYFVFGTVRQLDDSIEIASYMMDAEWGFVQGAGVVRVGLGLAIQGGLFPDNGVQVAAREGFNVAQAVVPMIDPFELRLRLAELARQTLLDPRERVVFVRNADAVQELLLKARVHTKRGDFTLALDLYRQALGIQPDNVGVQYLVQNTDATVVRIDFDRRRRERFQQGQPAWAAAQQQQVALAREAEALRIVAARQAAELDDTKRRLREAEREAAYNRLIAQALAAQKQNNLNVSVQIFESAVALRPNDDGFRQLALARAKADETARTNAAEAKAQRERDLRLQREKELAQVRQQVNEERRRRDAEDKTRLTAQKERDDAAYKRLLDTAEAATAKGKFDEAVSSLQTARTLRNNDEVNRLLNNALIGEAKATAAKKGEAAKAELEKQLAEEKQKREATEAEAKKNADLYTQALKLAQDAMAQKKYAVALARYQDASKVYKTDVVLTGLRAAQDAQAKERADADAVLAKQVAEKKRAEDVKTAMDKGQKALDAKQYDAAVQAFTQAKNLSPDNVDALTGLSKAQHAREAALALAKKKEADAGRAAKLKEALDQGRTALAKKDFTAAGKALDTASQLAPSDPDVLRFKQDLQTARDGSFTDADALKKKKAEFDALLKTGRDALTAKKYDAAIQAFTDASKLMPGDKDAATLLKQAQQAKTDALAAADKKLEEQKLRDQIKQLVAGAETAIKAGKFDDAAKALADARKLDPKDATVLQAAKDLEDARTAAANETAKKQREELQQLVSAAEADIKAGKFDAAAKALANAKKIAPRDPAVVKAAQDLEAARTAAANETAKKQREADYEKAIKSGRDALAAKKYDAAIQAFTDAGKMMPGDRDAPAFLKEAKQAKADALTASDADAKKKDKAEFSRLMDQGQSQMAAKKYPDAAKSFSDALKLMPDDANAKAWLKKAQAGKP